MVFTALDYFSARADTSSSGEKEVKEKQRKNGAPSKVHIRPSIGPPIFIGLALFTIGIFSGRNMGFAVNPARGMRMNCSP